MTTQIKVATTTTRRSATQDRATVPVQDVFSSNWLFGFALALGLAAGAGLVSAWLTPRGPITTAQALASLGGALVIGLLSGLAMRSRWSLLVTPLVFMIVFELARLGVDGPTVDGIHLGSMLGVIAFVLGRGLHGLLVLAPMAVGAAYGVWLAARLGPRISPTWGVAGWMMIALGTLALVALAVMIAQPATTAPILGMDGEPLPGSIAELTSVPIGGHEQALMIRGRSSENPVLLYLAGGPGGTDIGAMRLDTGLEQHFVVATWDQRGVGKSYAALDPTATLTLERIVADTIEVTNYLRQRFDEEKIYLVGNSWGATLGVLAVQQRPDLFHAYVGTGQMVSQRATDILFYEQTLAWAEETGNRDLASTLRQNGPPPYEDVRKYELTVMYEHDWNAFPEFDPRTEMPSILFVPEYSLMEKFNGFRSFLDTAPVVYPQLQGIDFRHDVPRLGVPLTVVMGEHEARGRAVLAHEWFDRLDAPSKELVVFEGAGHRPNFDRPTDFAALMARIAAQTYTDRQENVLTIPPARSLDNAGDVAAFFDDLIPGQLQNHHIAGATVAVVRGSDLLFAKGYGYADLEAQKPVVADRTLFYIGSDGKLFTWTAILQLVEQGKLDLHADINSYLDFTIPETFDEPITLHHLMTHTPGFEDTLNALFVDDPQDLLPLRDFLAQNMPARVYPPGEIFAYSNYGTALAGHIIERVSGESYEEYVTAHLLEPLGMTHSAAVQPLPASVAADMSKGYQYNNGTFNALDFEWVAAAPAAAIRSTATDVSRFMIAHLNEGCIEDVCLLQKDTLAQMHRQQFTHHPALTGMAYGFMETEINEQRVLWHMGQSARFSTLLALLPDEKVGVVVSYNTPMSDGRGVLTHFLDAFYPVASAAEPVQPLPGWNERAELWNGVYIPSHVAQTSPQKIAGWLEAMSVQAEADGILNVGGRRYVEIEPGIFHQQDGHRYLTFRQLRGQTWLFVGPLAYFQAPWHQTPTFHLALVAICALIFLSGWVAWPLAAWRERRRKLHHARSLWAARLLAISMGVFNLGLFAWFVLIMLNFSATYVYRAATVNLIVRLYWLAIPLTIGVLLLAIRAWRHREIHWGWRVHYSAVAVAGMVFLWFLYSWNLLAGL
jgi:proline iminopeptidase